MLKLSKFSIQMLMLQELTSTTEEVQKESQGSTSFTTPLLTKNLNVTPQRINKK